MSELSTIQQFSKVDISAFNGISSDLVAFLYAISQGVVSADALSHLYDLALKRCIVSLEYLASYNYIQPDGGEAKQFKLTPKGYKIISAMTAAALLELEEE